MNTVIATALQRFGVSANCDQCYVSLMTNLMAVTSDTVASITYTVVGESHIKWHVTFP
jgi:hypothetical protein